MTPRLPDPVIRSHIVQRRTDRSMACLLCDETLQIADIGKPCRAGVFMADAGLPFTFSQVAAAVNDPAHR